ncbi:MAG: glycoside hydrolase family 28 protein [bacterium]|nr:glycoside hydrolase family 28 protein [bacterium]
MNIKILMTTARSAVLEIEDGSLYETKKTYDVYLNGELVTSTKRVITNLFSLAPDTKYQVSVLEGQTQVGQTSFQTKYEFVTLNVKDFGAKGDGIQNDTSFIQAAIMACPKDSRVLIPEGTYLVTSLFLKSDTNIEIGKGARIVAHKDRSLYPKLQGLIESYDETKEYNLGTWEGNPLIMFAGIITGINAENVSIYGEGILDGDATFEDWWKEPKVMNGAFRPRLLYLNKCKDITVQGFTFKNSPSWTIHPYFSNQLGFYGLTVENPADSPNTDGLDPESCEDVKIIGVRFTLGDDCIAIKSGKIYMGKKYKVPSRNIVIRQCLMENGHGAVTIGSEMAAGVKEVMVRDCVFRHTDRGLRIKTRRGRGEDAVLDEIIFENIDMDHVMTPFVANSFYFCDPDGRSEYVQSKEFYPVDDRTPAIKHLAFRNIKATNCHVAAAYFYGLPEQKISCIEMKNVYVDFAENPKCDVPAMMTGIEPCSKMGIFAKNVETMIMENVEIVGQTEWQEDEE